MYRAEASSVVGFVQQLATVYVRSGYVRAAPGILPEGKSAVAFDRLGDHGAVLDLFTVENAQT